jgi:acyl transferase domain-containing protein/SAM-dependent methyltransferase
MQTLERIVGEYARAEALLEQASQEFVKELWCQLLSSPCDTSFGLETCLLSLGLDRRHHRLSQQLLRFAMDRGWVSDRNDNLEFVAEPAPLGRAVQQIEQAMREMPAYAGEFSLLSACLSVYLDVLRGQRDPLSVLFPEGSIERLLRVYRDSPHSALQASMAVEVIVEHLSRVPSGRRLRILEVGAGTGGTTRAVLAAVRPWRDRLTYRFTDVAPSLLAYGRQQFGNDPMLEYATLDIEKPSVASEGSEPADVVLAAHVLHATRDLRATLAHLRAHVRPDGLAVLLETCRTELLWVTLVFGLTEGWWRFDGADGRRDGPLLAADAWERLCVSNGFDSVHVLPAQGPECAIAARLLVARPNPQCTSGAAAPEELSARELGAPPARGLAKGVEAFLSEHVAQSLGVAAADVPREVGFQDLGFDSIFAQALTSKLGSMVKEPVPLGITYSHPTIAELARHLASTYPQALASALPGNPASTVRPVPAQEAVSRSPAVPTVIGSGAVSAPFAARHRAAELVPSAKPEPPTELPATGRASATILDASRWEAGEVSASGDTIAVIGYSGRFPGARDEVELWNLLSQGQSAVRAVSLPELRRERRAATSVPADPPCAHAALLDDLECFDHDFFRLSIEQASLIDPRHRLLLEEAWRALEHAGAAGKGLARSRTGVFVGLSRESYRDLVARPSQAHAQSFVLGNSNAAAANRISHFLDLRGPSVCLDALCASSLVALHQACQSLRLGECDMAVVGAANALLGRDYFDALDSMGMLSRTGTCRPFDQTSDGFALGEGVAALVLKRLDRALHDGDAVHALVVGTAVLHNGMSVGFGAPSPLAAADLYRAAHRGPIDLARVATIEGHGTGTPLGDQLELEGLAAALDVGPSAQGRCGIASSKANLGHGEAVAGLSGILKLILEMQHQQIVAAPPIERSLAELGRMPLFVEQQSRPWPRGAAPRRAGVTGFGMGGVGAHVVLEEPPEPARVEGHRDRTAHVCTLSARTPAALAQAQARLLAHLERPETLPDLGDVCFTLAVGRRHFEQRWAVTCRTIDELRAVLADSAPTTAACTGALARDMRVPLALVVGELRAANPTDTALLLDTSATFRRAVLEVLEASSAADQAAALGALTGANGRHPLADFAFAYALGRCWLEWGVRRELVLGGGSGSEVARVLTGDVSLADALPGEGRASAPLANGAKPREAWLDDEALVVAIGEPGVLGQLDAQSAGEWIAGGEGDVWERTARTLASLYVRGGDIAWEEFDSGRGRRKLPLPTYRFDSVRCWGLDGAVAGTSSAAVTASSGEVAAARGVPSRAPQVPLRRRLRAQVARILGVDERDVSLHESFMDMGIDSVALVQWIGDLSQRMNAQLSPTLLFKHRNIEALAGHLEATFPDAAARFEEADAQTVEADASGAPSLGVGAPDAPSSNVGVGSAAPSSVRSVNSGPARSPAAGTALPPASDARSAPSQECLQRPIAIIGYACRLPGCDDASALWDLLREGRDAIVEVPEERWNGLREGRAGSSKPIAPRWAGLVDGIDVLDAGFFEMSPREARAVDPQQRLLLSVTWEALEHAGQVPGAVADTGTFMGVATGDYADLHAVASDPAARGVHYISGVARAMVANRISYTLGLSGPSLSVDTACSSSLVAIHLACQSLRARECRLAIAGGVNALLSPENFVGLTQAKALSPSGRCRTFSEEADGYVRGEGAAVVVLKDLDDAVRDGDRIHAVIRGSAVNQDGRTNGITAPNPAAQQAVIERALACAGIAADTISYVEAHGTGTKLGDPIEVEALALAHRRSSQCALGSVKTNLGHLEAAAGVAGVLKVLLAMKEKALPPSLHAARLNPIIPFSTLPFFVNQELRAWGGPLPRRAAVSSFGFGGTNCHLVLEQGPEAPEAAFDGELVLALSARTPHALGLLEQRWIRFLERAPQRDLRDACFTAYVGRRHWEHRVAVVGRTATDLIENLQRALAGRAGPGVSCGRFQDVGSLAAAHTPTPARAVTSVAEAAAGFVAGVMFDPAAIFGPGARPLPVPTYPFDGQRHNLLASGAEVARAEVAAAEVASGDSASNLLYDVDWEPSPAPDLLEPLPLGTWLVFAPSAALADAWSTRLRASGRRVVSVLAGPAYAQPEPNRFVVHPGRAADYRRLLAETGRVGYVLYLTALCAATDPVPDELAAVEHGLATGVNALLLLAQALFELGDSSLELRVVAADADQTPERAALLGLANVLAREESMATRVVSVDLGSFDDDPVAALDRVLRAGPGFVRLAGDREYRRVLCPRVAAARAPLPRGPGAVLIPGGGSGIGLEVCRLLARETDLDLVLVHRSPERRAAVAELERLGARVTYVQADVGSLEQMSAVAEQARRRSGAIRGVIHSGGVLRDRLLRGSDWAALSEVLDPKVRGSWVLDRITRDDPLDFFVLFSSIASLLAPPGQAAHAAANAYEDALALVRRAAGRPALAINWGLWGETGSAAHARYIEPLSARGVLPMRSHAAVQAFRCALEVDAPQVAIAALEPALLFGAKDRPPLRLGQRRAAALVAAGPASAMPGNRAEPWPAASDAGAELELQSQGMTAAALVPWLTSSGVLEAGSTENELVATLGVQPGRRSQFSAVIDCLAMSGHLVRRGEQLTLASACLPTLQRAFEQACAKLPALRASLQVLKRCLEAAPAVLTGQARAVDVLFPGGSTDDIERLYTELPSFGDLYRRAGEAVREALARARERSESCAAAVLEVGAGTGAATRDVVAAIAGICERYTFTDISPQFFRKARAALAQYPFVEYHTFDVTRDPLAQGLRPASYDVIVAANVVHATPEVRETLASMTQLLTPAGRLVLIEVTEPGTLGQMIFGLTDGWWSFRDAPYRTKSPCLSRAAWRELLVEAGCEVSVEPPRPLALGCRAEVIVADQRADARRAPAEHVRTSAARDTVTPGGVVAAAQVSEHAVPGRAVNDHGQLLDRAEALLTHALARSLDRSPDELDHNKGFLELGVDSLISSEVAAAIDVELSTSLPATLFFEHTTIARLADYLVANHAQALRASKAHESGETPAAAAERAVSAGTAIASNPVVTAQATAAGLGRIERGAQEPIAVVGAACRLPGASSLAQLWTLLREGTDAVIDRPERRRGIRYGVGLRAGLERGGFLDSVDGFDARLFQISPAEAKFMDPQHRLLLEVAWEAFEDAACGREDLAGRPVGVFVGASSNQYREGLDLRAWLGLGRRIDPAMGIGNSNAIIANRISYMFDLRGPSMTVDTICSSSLVALHLAVQSLRRNECEAAIVGGVHLHVSPSSLLFEDELGALSKDGRSRTFDAKASGFGPAEGAVALVLKPLSRALSDRDHIDALLLGSAVAHGGRGSGLAAPNAEGQEALLVAAYADAGVSPASLSYVEAHGTGTALGDPIELGALTRALRRSTSRSGFCALGSIKTNFGHAEAAAGLAGLLKVILALKHQEIPPSLHFEEPNRLLELERSPFFLTDRRRAWPRSPDPRRAGVSSFGMGGSNAHVVVEEAPVRLPVAAPQGRPELFAVSAQSEAALLELCHRLGAHLAQHPELELADVCFSASVCRASLPHRLAAVVDSMAGLAEILRRPGFAPPALQAVVPSQRRPRVKMFFPHEQGVWAARAAALSQRWDEFRTIHEQRVDAGRRHLGRGGAAEEVIAQLAVARLLERWGVIGDSASGAGRGSYAAAAFSGALSLDEALERAASDVDDTQRQAHGSSMAGLAGSNGAVEVAAGWLVVGRDDSAGVDAVACFGASPPERSILNALTQLIVWGVEVRWARLFGPDSRRVSLPTYPFQREPHWAWEDAPQTTFAPSATVGTALAGAPPTPAGEQLAQPEEPLHFWQFGWRESPLAQLPERREKFTGTWLVFADELGMALAAVEPLAAEGAEIVSVHRGKGWRELGPGRFMADAARPDHIEQLAELVRRSWPALRGVIYAWDAGFSSDVAERPADLDRAVFEGPGCLLDVLKQTLPMLGDGRGSFWHITSYAHALDAVPRPVCAERATSCGLIKVAAREEPASALRICDVDPETESPLRCATHIRSELVAWLSDQVGREGDGVVVYREGKRFVSQVLQVAAPEAAALPPAGTFLITGGASGIGLEVAKHLARTSRARLAIVARNPSDVSAELEGLGAEVWVLRADVADAARMQEVVSAVRARWGGLHGVLHAAGVLNDQPLAEVTRDGLMQTLRAKVRGTAVLHEVTRGEPLEMFVLFSSMASSVALPGQAAHVAGCAFQDAFAHQRARQGLPACAIDWGLWGETGVVAAPAKVRELARLGARPLSTREGIEAFVALAASGVVRRGVARFAPALVAQLVASRVPPAATASDSIGVQRGASDADRESGPAAPELTRLARDRIARMAAEQGLREAERADAELDAVAASICADVVERFGLARSAAPLTDEVMAALGVAPVHRRLFRALQLHARGAPLEGAAWRERLATAADRHPRWVQDFRLLERCGEHLAEVLTGACSPHEVLFPNGDTSLLAAVYERSPVVAACNGALGTAVRDIALARRGQRLRVLEVGAGTGGTTRHVLEAASAVDMEYWFTDCGQTFLDTCPVAPAAPVRLVRRLLDVERDLAEQGFSAASFDVVIAANVLHATRDIAAAVETVRLLLAPGGVLLLVEATAPRAWLDVTVGMMAGWWLFADAWRSTSPLVGRAQWRALLQASGFASIGIVGGAGDDADPISLLIASAEGDLPRGLARRSALRPPNGAAKPTDIPGVEAARAAPAAPRAQASELDVYVQLVQREVASALQLREVVDIDMPLRELGIDSIRSVAMVRGLSSSTGIRLAPGVVFMCPTVRALAEHLAARAAEAGCAISTEPSEATNVVHRGPVVNGEPEGVSEASASSRQQVPFPDGAVAIVGMACRFPDAESPERFWQNLVARRRAIGTVPADRWRAEEHYSADADAPGKSITKWAGWVERVAEFDPLAFHISPRDARLIDPQQRLLLEAAAEALEDAAGAGQKLAGSRVGVFVGATAGEYRELISGRLDRAEPSLGAGTAPSIVANRISYCFDLRGPSVVVDTACSSSLVALHWAIDALARGDCEQALVGGVNVMLTPEKFVVLSKARLLAAGDRCNVFGSDASGYVRGEGAAVIVIKPLARALAEGDHIHAVVRATAVNQDGRTNGISAPNPEAQTDVVLRAWARAGIDPATLAMVEAHGTATKLGDPLEVTALRKAFLEHTRARGFCALGSVKAVIGHLEPAAGVAGLIKAALALRHRAIPPALYVETVNPELKLDDSPFYLPDRVVRFERSGPMRAAVSGFGFGGTNCHVVLEEAPERVGAARAAPADPEVLALSARTPSILRAYAERMLDFLRNGEAFALQDICYSANTGRRPWPARLAVTGRSRAELAAELARKLALGDGVVRPTAPVPLRLTPDGDGDRMREQLLRRGVPPRALVAADSAGRGHAAASDVHRPADALAALWERGWDIDWYAAHAGGAALRRVPLPPTPFERARHWVDAPEPPPAPPGAVDRAASRATAWRVGYEPIGVPESDLGAGRWVIVAPRGDELARALVARLTSAGCEASLLAADRAAREEPWSELLETSNALAGAIVLDPADSDAGGTASALESEHRARTEPLLACVRAMAARRTEGLRLVVATRAGDRSPTAASVRALSRSIGAEMSRMAVQIIDLHEGADTARAVDALLLEIGSGAAGQEVAWRNGVRMAPTLLPARLPLGRHPLRDGATYLVTGGGGGIAAEVARDIARRCRASIALVGRSAAPKQPDLVRQIEALGSRCVYLRADVSCRSEIEDAVQTIRSRFGSITGVVHAAGRIDEEAVSLANKSPESFRAVQAPKVVGTCHLAGVLADDPPEFVALMSSFAGVAGRFAAGLGDYAAANAYLDGFARQRAGAGKTQWMAFDWAEWEGIGMAARRPRFAGDYQRAGLVGLKPSEALDLLWSALVWRQEAQLVMLAAGSDGFDPNPWLAPRRAANEPAAAVDRAPVQRATPPGPPRREPSSGGVGATRRAPAAAGEELLPFLKQLLGGLLRIAPEELAPDSPLADYGVDSLVIADFLRGIERRLGVALNPAVVLEHPTLASLAAHLGAPVAPSSPARSPLASARHDGDPELEILRALERGELSEDEALRRLSSLETTA